MAYNITSEKGKDIAESMKTGETYKASDGSTWKKNSDGSVSVTTAKGEKFDNAYTPTSNTSGGSGGGGGSKGGGGNSPTTTFDPSSGMNKYAQYDPNTDYSIRLNRLMQNGASADEVYDSMMYRFNKATDTTGLENYILDDTYYAAWNYVQNAKQAEADQQAKDEYFDMLNRMLANEGRPTAPQSDPRIDALLNQILNREDFSYDASKDPLYQQYADIYQREGDRAMRDTMAEAVASAGGMNTYAMTAAQQAANYYNSQLGDKIPELYQLAYDMYLRDKESQVENLGLLRDMDNTQYARYRDTMNDYYNDRNFAYGAYADAVQQGNWQKNFDYNSMWDNMNFQNSNYWADKNFNANQAQIDTNNSQHDTALAREEVEACIADGVMPDADTIKRAGMNYANVEARVEARKAEMASSKSTIGNVVEGGDDDGYIVDKKGEDVTGDAYDGSDINTITLGIGPKSESYVLSLIEKGLVILDANGTVRWADGVDANNYKEILASSRVPW